MKKIIIVSIVALAAVALVALPAIAIDSTKCMGKAMPCGAKPVRAQAPAAPEEMQFKRNVLGQKVPVYSYHKDGKAMNDTATKYEPSIVGDSAQDK